MVFHTREGRPLRNNLQTNFRRIVARAGIRYCSLHDLRRTFITHLAMEGVNAAVVQKLAGHSSIQTTQKYYTNILPEALRSAQARLPFGEAIRAVPVSDSYHAPKERRKEETARITNLMRDVS